MSNVLCNEIHGAIDVTVTQHKVEGVVQSQHNKATRICRPIRDERIAEILASTELNPSDIRRREKDSGVSRDSLADFKK